MVAWNLNMNPCVKITEKKQRKKTGAGKGQVRVVKKSEAVDSFFNFFTPPIMPEASSDPEDLSEELQEQLFRDFELGDVLKDRVIPHAVLWFTGEAMGDDDDEMGEEEDDEEGPGDEEDSDGEDPDYAPPVEGEKPAECKNQ